MISALISSLRRANNSTPGNFPIRPTGCRFSIRLPDGSDMFLVLQKLYTYRLNVGTRRMRSKHPEFVSPTNLTDRVSSPKEATSPKGRGQPLSQNQIMPRFRGWDMKQCLNFTLPPYRGGHHGGYLSGPAPADARWNASVGGSSLAIGFVPTP